MSDKSLRLRTAGALGWVRTESITHSNGYRTDRYQYRDSERIAFVDYNPKGDVWHAAPMPLPLYGTSWASCEEIDAECKKRGWILMHDGDKDGDRVVLTGSRHGLFPVDLGEAFAPTFPAAFAEAFCQACEASRG
jgi:hypothetical protein